MTVRRLLCITALVGAVALGASGCSGGASSTATDASSASASQSNEAVPPADVPTTAAPRTLREYASGDIIKTVTVTKPNAFGDFGYDDNSPDFNMNATNGVAFKYWGCRKPAGEVFNGVLLRVEVGTNGDNGYLDGHDEMDRNPVEMTTPTGQGLIHIWGSGPEGHPHYPVTVTNDGQCNFRLYYISVGSDTGPDLGRQVLSKSGAGNGTVDTPNLGAPWRLAWSYTCSSSTSFVVADSVMGDGHIVQRTGNTSGNGVFEQGVEAGSRTLSVTTGGDCQWQLSLYEN